MAAIADSVGWYPSLIEHRACGDRKRCRELFDDADRRIASATLDIADICAVDVGTVSIFLLTPALFEAEAAEIGGKAETDVHQADEARLSLMNLQTISDI